MKVFRLLVLLAVLIVGLIIGAMNMDEMTINLLFTSSRPRSAWPSLPRC